MADTPTLGITVFCDYCGEPATIPEKSWADCCRNKGCPKFGHIMVIPVPQGKRYVKIECEIVQFACLDETQSSIRCRTCHAEHIVDNVALLRINGQPIYETAKCTGFIKRRLNENETLRKSLAEEEKRTKEAVIAQKRMELDLTEKIKKLEKTNVLNRTSYRTEFVRQKELCNLRCKDMDNLKIRNAQLENEIKKYKEEKDSLLKHASSGEEVKKDAMKEKLNYYIGLSQEQKFEIEALTKKCEELEGAVKHSRDVASLERQQKVDAVFARDELDKKLKETMAERVVMMTALDNEKSSNLQQQMNWNELLESVEANNARTEAMLKTKELALDKSAALLQKTLKQNSEALAQLKCKYEKAIGGLTEENKKLKEDMAKMKEKKSAPQKIKPLVFGMPVRTTPAFNECSQNKTAHERMISFQKLREKQRLQSKPKFDFSHVQSLSMRDMNMILDQMFSNKEDESKTKDEQKKPEKEDEK